MLRTLRAACLLAACTLAIATPLRAQTAGDGELRERIFVVDPGHGTRQPSGAWLNGGAAGPDGVAERAVTLAIGEDLARLLRGAGAEVVLTRSYSKPYRVATDTHLDNRARAALANRIGATAFVALHADSSLDRAARGTSVFWLRPNSLPLAGAVRAHLAALGLGEHAFRARDLAVTNEARVPAVLVELGFVSNPVQERLLAEADFQRRAARALFDAIEETFGR
ncbi:MAG: N-acetylmuramoyl-L-alanine amidase [Candidatus Eremiobacteraeota bacterium]|nr:N-acetylmuramoyl-L-alanine amidase [Candidatus Eremiobacteraeota bacterium]